MFAQSPVNFSFSNSSVEIQVWAKQDCRNPTEAYEVKRADLFEEANTSME